MFELLDIVRVKKEYPELSLTPKHIGTIVDVHNGGEAYTVEFIDENGDTIEKALYTEFSENELEYVPTILDGSLEERTKVMKKFFGLKPEQSFQDIDIDDDKDYICDDRPIEIPEWIKKMTDEEIKIEFQRRFGKYIEKDDNFEEIYRQYQTKTPSEWEDEFEKEKERIQKLKEISKLDDIAAKAGGYVVPSYMCDFDASAELAKFREYCELLGKKPEQLTQEELQKYYKIEKTIKKVKYVGESDPVSLLHGKIYICLGEEHGEYRIIDKEGYDKDEEIQGYLYPKRFFVEVNDD